MSAPARGTITVLHVDDDPDFADVTATFLERAGERFTVETGTSASEGIDRLENDGVDCIVSDYEMPGQDGIEFLEAVRDRYPALPFILFTALAFALGVFFSYYVVLPFSIPILLSFLGDQAVGLLSIGRYISSILLLMAVFGLMFELPVLGYLLARLGFVRAQLLRKYRRYSIIAGLVLAAVITPTADPFNFALVAVPLVVLYEITIIVVHFSQRKDTYGTEDTELTQADR
jgi:CheY-like chemotaxis protein